MKNFWKHFFIDNGDITLIEAGLQQNFPNQANDYLVKHDYVIHIVLFGKGTFKVDQQTFHLKPHDCFILKKNKQVYYESHKNDPWLFGWIGLGGANIHQYFQNTLIATEDAFHFEQNSQVFEQLFTLIKYLNTMQLDARHQKIKVLGDLYLLLAEISKELYTNNSYLLYYDAPQKQLAQDIYQHITNHYERELSVEDIAQHFDISRNYLFQLCKKFFNQSPKQMILELRMIRAAQLLQGTVLQISEIADMIGYKDTFQFSKMFKKHFGYNPSKFRQLDTNTFNLTLLSYNQNK